jgi:AcrR family transcriptional regulator
VTNLVDLQRAAVATFAERGYAATGIRDIASAAGVTSGALYMHAPSKMALLQSVMHLVLDELLSLADTVASATTDPAARLAALVRCHVAVQATNPYTARVVDGEVRILPPQDRPEIIRKRDAYEKYWTTALSAGVASGAFTVDDLTVSRLALLEMCNGVAQWYHPDGRLDLRQLQDVFVRLSLNMLRYRGDAPPAGVEPTARLLPCEPPHSPGAPVGSIGDESPPDEVRSAEG